MWVILRAGLFVKSILSRSGVCIYIKSYRKLYSVGVCVCVNVILTADALQGFGCRLSDLIDQLLTCLLCSLGLTIDREEIIINKDLSACPAAHLSSPLPLPVSTSSSTHDTAHTKQVVTLNQAVCKPQTSAASFNDSLLKFRGSGTIMDHVFYLYLSRYVYK